MIGYLLTFLLCTGTGCARVEIRFETLQMCLLQAQPAAAWFAARAAEDSGHSITVRAIECTTDRQA